MEELRRSLKNEKINRSLKNTCIIFNFLLMSIFLITNIHLKFKLRGIQSTNLLSTNQKTEVVIATVACGNRLEEALNMIKSALLFNIDLAPLKFIVMTEPNLFPQIENKLYTWKSDVHFPLTYEIHPTQFPEENGTEWRKLLLPCASQRLFFPVRIQKFLGEASNSETIETH